ncbi:MAG: hypothetical protein J5526_07650 [Bacteroidales bacterium]|nr:hypothetical protein [Bacteroidales bacterium]
MMIKKSIILIAGVALIMCGCKKENEVKCPGYLHLDKIDVVERADAGAPSPVGFLSSDVDAVQITAFWEGDEDETNLGVYQLPCTLPVLRDKTITRLRLVPVVKQNGIAATRIEYPYYEYIRLTDVPLATDSTTNLGVQDADGKWTLSTTYRPWTVQQIVDGQILSVSDTLVKVLAQEYFEASQVTWIFYDTNRVVDRTVDPAEICTGTGSGVVNVPADKQTLTFEINNDIVCNDPGAYLYLEMDFKTDVRLSVGMKSAYYSGGTQSLQSAMTLYETNEWKKIYINLGRLWAQFNHNSKFRVVFTALNSEGTGGKVYLDNVKLLQM